MSPGCTTVASVPSGHVYVRHLAPETESDGTDVGRVVRLPDPDPDDATRSAQQRWWPPVMLDPDWVGTHDFDVMHLQFGFDAWEPGDLRAVVDAVHARGRGFVYTLHDLRNPHHASRALHDAQLDVLVPSADALLTLTPGAAAEVERRWGRRPHVVPHPHVVDLPTMRRLARERRTRAREGFRVGLHVKSLRASMDPLVLLPALVEAVSQVPGGVLQVDGHADVLDPAGARYSPALRAWLLAARRRGEIDLRVHDYFSDAELWDYLSLLDVSVLPYRFGTHSGWLEACRDLGTAVVAPTCGYFADQGPVHSFVLDEHTFDHASLVEAVLAAAAQGPPDPVDVEVRRAERAALAAFHATLYRGLR